MGHPFVGVQFSHKASDLTFPRLGFRVQGLSEIFRGAYERAPRVEGGGVSPSC